MTSTEPTSPDAVTSAENEVSQTVTDPEIVVDAEATPSPTPVPTSPTTPSRADAADAAVVQTPPDDSDRR